MFVNSYLFSYLYTYIWDIFFKELFTKVKPNINLVEVHSQLSNYKLLVDGALVDYGIQIKIHFCKG
jgi:hypothetical protein